ncbi:succinyl-diaminopimelate desuccinylase [Nereida ignava]|uniref:succinyl-diaminopimelate desuccinylase n=1 Tax=Nereida ignava TaxID=282199 RepID=UPI0030F56CA7
MSPVDPVQLTADLVRCPSVTPTEGGALVLLEKLLSEAGFECTRVDRGETANLFARWGTKGHAKTFGFNGHTDVVPIGDAAAWKFDPFGAEVVDGTMYGRGTTDMKSGVAAFAAAAIDHVRDTPPDGSLILAITGDEEGPALDGTIALLEWMDAQNEQMSVCLVGEPTCPDEMGDMMKIGRRGSLTAWFTVTGKQGHAAYPHRANNPLPAIARLVDRIASHELDQGSDHFDPSTIAVVTIDTGNPATNVIPAAATAAVNIRFNDLHSGETVSDWLRAEAAEISKAYEIDVSVDIKISGESFITPPGALSDMVAAAVQAETNRVPTLSTSGGTSDARFVKDHCPVVEFGLVGKSMHQVDEHVEIAHIHQLKTIYARILRDYFA